MRQSMRLKRRAKNWPSYESVFLPVAVASFSGKVVARLDNHWSHIATVCATIHLSGISSQPEANLLRFTHRTESFCGDRQPAFPTTVLAFLASLPQWAGRN